MINNAQFRLIGRIGKVTKLDKVTHISVASDRKVKDDEGNWTTETNWNTITTFSEQMRKRLDNSKVGKKGNQIIAEGSIQSNSYEKDGATVYKTNLIVHDFEVLSFTKDTE